MTKQTLIDAKGRFTPGVLDQPVETINYLDYDLRTVMDKPRSQLARRSQPRRGSRGSRCARWGVARGGATSS